MTSFLWSFEELVGLCKHKNSVARSWAADRLRTFYPEQSEDIMEKLIFDPDQEVAREGADYFIDNPDAGDTNVLLNAYRKNEGFLAGRLAHVLSMRKEGSLINAFLDKYHSDAENDAFGYPFSLVNIALLGTPESRHVVQEGLESIEDFGENDMSIAGAIFAANLVAGTDIRMLFRFCTKNPGREKFLPSLLTQIAKHCGSWYSEQDITEEVEKKMLGKELPYMVKESFDIIEECSYGEVTKAFLKHYKKGSFRDILRETREFVKNTMDEKGRELGRDRLLQWETQKDAPFSCIQVLPALDEIAETLPKTYLEPVTRAAVAILSRFVEFMPLIGVFPEELDVDEAIQVFFQERETTSQDDRIMEMLAHTPDKGHVVTACLDHIAYDPHSLATRRIIKLLGKNINNDIAEIIVKVDPSRDDLWDAIVAALIELGEPAVDVIGRFIESADKERIPYALAAMRDLPFDGPVKIILDHWDMLWSEFKEDLLDTIYWLGDKRFIQPLKGELRDGELEDAETYYSLCVINNIIDPKLKEIEREIERNKKKAERRLDALHRGDAKDILMEPVEIDLCCRSCRNTYRYTIHKIAVDPESGDKFIFDKIICKKCGALDHYEITENGEFAITSYLTLLVSVDKKKMGSPDEFTIFPMAMGTLDGKRTPLKETIARFEKKLEKHPESPIHLLGYANILRRGKRTEDATFIYEKVIRCDPMAVEAYSSLADIAYIKDDFETAYSYSKKAAEIINTGNYYKINIDLDEFKTTVLDNYMEAAKRLGKKVSPPGLASSPSMQPVGQHGKVGRNDPCPCGSGKKYKKCCLLKKSDQGSPTVEPARPVVDLVFKRFNEKLERFSRGISRNEFLKAAGKYWKIEPKEPLAFPERASHDKGEFYEWFIHDHRLASGKRIIESFIEKQGSALTEPEKILANALAKSYQGIYEIQEVTEGKGLSIKDIFTGEECFIREVSGSYTTVKWDLIMVRVYETDSISKFAGNGRVLPRQNLDGLMEFLQKRRDDFQKKTSKPGWPAFMKEKSYVVHHYFDELAENPPVIVTEEKHGVIVARAHFESSHFEKILDILGEEFDFVIEEETPHKTAQLTWLKRGASKDWVVNENPPEHHVISSFSLVHSAGQMSWTTLGTITVFADGLTLECFSKERLERGKKRLEELLAGLIRHKIDEFEDINVGMERSREKGKGDKNKAVTGDEAVILESILRKHYEKWPDEHIPVLNGMTPREAVKTKEGRQKVDDLLKSFENMEERKHKSGERSIDIGFIRKELGL